VSNGPFSQSSLVKNLLAGYTIRIKGETGENPVLSRNGIVRPKKWRTKSDLFDRANINLALHMPASGNN